MSLDEKVRIIRQYAEKYLRLMMGMQDMYYTCCVVAVFDEYIIALYNDDYYKINYTFDETTEEVSFANQSEWVEVEQTWIETTKSIWYDTKAVWTTAYINDLPDSSFLFISKEQATGKDDEGKTEPRSARYFPYKDSEGNIDLPHLRNAIARIPQAKAPDLSQATKARLQEKAKTILESENKSFVSFGNDVIKTSVDGNLGTVSAYGIRFSDDNEKDLTGDYFTKNTDYGFLNGDGVAATLNHRIPLKTKYTTKKEAKALTDFSKRIFSKPVKAVKDDVGILVEHVLDLSDEYEKVIFELANQGKFRWSSGSANHMVDKAEDGKIKTWHIVEWAYTPMAAEPRLPTIAPIKSADELVIIGNEKGEVYANVKTEIVNGENEMDYSELEKRINTLEENFTKSVEKIVTIAEGMNSKSKAGYITDEGGKADPDVKSFGDFLLAVKRKDIQRLRTVYKSTKDMSIEDGATGGYLVPPEHEETLLKLAQANNQIVNRVRHVPVKRDSGTWPALDQFITPTAGSGQTALAGNVKATTKAAGSTLDKTDPKFTMLEWRLYKEGGYTEVDNELVEDSPEAIEALLSGLFAIAIGAKMERHILRGSGVGEPLGILNAPCLVTVAANLTNTFKWVDVAKVFSRFLSAGGTPVWITHPGSWEDILTMEIGTGGASAWVANMAGGQGNQLNGYSILTSEHMPQPNNDGHTLLADLGAYLLFERKGLTIAYSEHAAFTSDQATWRFTQRATGMPWLKNRITLADPQGSYYVSPFVAVNNT